MSVNSSFSNVSLNSGAGTCFGSDGSLFVFAAVFINNLLLLPVFLLVLYLGCQQWKQRGSTGQSDLFTYHAIAMQLNEFLGLSLFFVGGYIKNTYLDQEQSREMVLVGRSFLKVTSMGQSMFHILTCVEHYLAVVHPITYLHLRQSGEVTIKNISSGCVWFLSFGWLLVFLLGSDQLNWTLYYCIMAFELVVLAFCNASVLCALKRSGPGDKERVDQSKQRAFYTICAIMGLFLFRFVGNVSSNLVFKSNVTTTGNYCVVLMFIVWIDLPSSLVLPLLFLHRAGKLGCCKQSTE